jgi:bifunctional UDP-N-acetylglucosamine pyrophosphorylase/glucosamine-1-phosphate N-acetyltransferase
MNKKTSVMILGAGNSVRMKSNTSKLLHKVGNLELINHILNTVKQLDCEETVMVLSQENMEEIKKIVGDDINMAIQTEKLGTGDATKVGYAKIKNKESNILIVYGDTPLVKAETYKKMIETLDATDNAVMVLGFDAEDIDNKYGRLVVKEKELVQIVEYKDANEDERSIRLCNSGIAAVKGKYLEGLLSEIDNNNAAKEYYLTSIVKIAIDKGLKCGYIRTEEKEVLGINSRYELTKAEKVFQDNKRREFMLNGATLLDPDSVYFSFDTKIGKDVVIEQNVVFLSGVQLEDNTVVKAFSYLEGCVVEKGASVGPFARIRPETILKQNSKIGNFVEIKKSTIGEGVKINHLTYIGDTEIGKNTNIGCGTVTCNYDGYKKSKTKIGENNFIGSNTIFVAPVETGDNCLTAAGSVITKNVEGNAIAISRSEQRNIENGMQRYKSRRDRENK